MHKISYDVIGLMSGTSLDGLDMIHSRFRKINNRWHYRINKYQSIRYSEEWHRQLQNAINLNEEELRILDNSYGRWLGERTAEFISEQNLKAELISSHGHTVFHQPDKGLTLQIGSGQEIANITGKKVVCDFRKHDVSLSGQGAPLVPIGDKHLFNDYSACINIGGISNISFEMNQERIAFDIGVANMLLNYLASQIGKPYDSEGTFARSGSIDNKLLNNLNNIDYYALSFPKSTGYEWFLSEVKPIIDSSIISIGDKMATSVEHEAIQIAKVLQKYLKRPGDVLLTGGGVLNEFLIERIRYYRPDHLNIIIPDKTLIESKEALIFAFMGVLKVRNEINCLKTVTGAIKDSICGDVFEPPE